MYNEEEYVELVNYVIGLRATKELSKINPKNIRKGMMKMFAKGSWQRPRAAKVLEDMIKKNYPQYLKVFEIISLLK